MFLKTVRQVKGGEVGYYCSLVESKWVGGVCKHVTKASLGFFTPDRLPYLKAAFSSGDPAEAFGKAAAEEEARKDGQSQG